MEGQRVMGCNSYFEDFKEEKLAEKCPVCFKLNGTAEILGGSHPRKPSTTTTDYVSFSGITQGQFDKLMASNEEIKKMIKPKIECLNASEASSNDLHEMFNDNELEARYIIEGYNQQIENDVLLKIYNDLKVHTEAVMQVTVIKGDETKEIRDIQRLSYDLLQRITAHIFPADSYDVKRNGFFKTSDVVAESSDRVVKFRGKFDEMVTVKGTTFAVLSLEDKNPKSKKIPKKSIAQGVIQACAMHRALVSIDCSPKHLFTLIHNGLEWILVLRRINNRGAEQYLYTIPVECTSYDKKTKLRTISEDGLKIVSRLLYVALKTTLNTLDAVQSRLKNLLLTSQGIHVSEFKEDFDDNDEEEPEAGGDDHLSNLFGSLKLSSAGVSTQQLRQSTASEDSKEKSATTEGSNKRNSTGVFSKPVEFLQLTAKNLLLAPAMC